MTTITAPTGRSGVSPPPQNAAPGITAAEPARPLWQVPVFVLGVAALAGVWFGRQYITPSPTVLLRRDLVAARHILARADGDAEQALKLAHRALEMAEKVPDRAGEAALVVGTAHLRLAEKA